MPYLSVLKSDSHRGWVKNQWKEIEAWASIWANMVAILVACLCGGGEVADHNHAICSVCYLRISGCAV